MYNLYSMGVKYNSVPQLATEHSADASTECLDGAVISSHNLESSLSCHGDIKEVELDSHSLLNASEQLVRQLDTLNGELLSTLQGSALAASENIILNTQRILEHGEDSPLAGEPHTDEYRLAQQLQGAIRANPNAGFLDRGRLMIDGLGGMLSNDFTAITERRSRRSANMVSVAIRTGSIVALTTLLRQMIGFAIENQFQHLGSTASLSPRMVASIVSMLLGPGLNLAGAIRDERNGTATATSRISRISMALLSMGGLMIAASHRPADTVGSLMGSLGPQMAAYTLSRDLIQLFFPLRDNTTLNASGLFCSTLMYGMAQCWLGEAAMSLAPQSGASYARSEANRLAAAIGRGGYASAIPAVIAAPNLIHDVIFSALNALTEAFDDLQRAAFMHHFRPRVTVPDDKRNNKRDEKLEHLAQAPLVAADAPISQGLRIGVDRPRIGAGHWPSATQVADQFLTTNAMRTSFFEAIVGIALTVSTALDATRLNDVNRGHVVNAVVGALVLVGYPAFVAVHDQRSAGQAEEK